MTIEKLKEKVAALQKQHQEISSQQMQGAQVLLRIEGAVSILSEQIHELESSLASVEETSSE